MTRELQEARAIVRFYLRTQCSTEPSFRRRCPSGNAAHDRARLWMHLTDPKKKAKAKR